MIATIIISALDEPYLCKTLETVLLETPEEMLAEIIIIDDCSTVPIAKVDLPNSDKIQIVRNDKRMGLIWSRQYATSLAKSPIVVSLDAHVKVQKGWLSPLRDR